MNSKIASILFDEGIYILNEEKNSSKKKALDLKGNPNSNTLCLFINEDFSHPHDEELVLAENIMKAINIEKGNYSWAYSKSVLEEHNFEHTKVFIFHSGTIVDKTEFPLNELIDFKSSKVLRTYSLTELISDVNKKKELWSCLVRLK